MIYIQRTEQEYQCNTEDHLRGFVAVKPQTVAAVESYREANAEIRRRKQTDPTGIYYTSYRPCENWCRHRPQHPGNIVVGATYRNRHAGTTTRTVLAIENDMVRYTASNKPGEHSVRLKSFALWAGTKTRKCSPSRGRGPNYIKGGNIV